MESGPIPDRALLARGSSVKYQRGGTHGAKRLDGQPLESVQAANQAWWEQTPMSYDWDNVSGLLVGSRAWFDHQDRRSSEQHRHFLQEQSPVDLLLAGIPLEGEEVLEIGTGSGWHAELLARRGARVTALDISRPAVALARRRFELKGLTGTLETWDAEEDRSDFHERFAAVWSWGVLHHSAHTARIVRNVSRWVRSGGAFAGMVYHRDSTRLPLALVRDWIIGNNWRDHSVDEALWRSSDGFTARFYPADQWRDLLLAFFATAHTSIGGLDVDVVPLPQPIRGIVWNRLRADTRKRCLERCGHFLMFRANNPRRD